MLPSTNGSIACATSNPSVGARSHPQPGVSARQRFDGVDDVAEEVGVADVEADAGVTELGVALEEPNQRVGRRQ